MSKPSFKISAQCSIYTFLKINFESSYWLIESLINIELDVYKETYTLSQLAFVTYFIRNHNNIFHLTLKKPPIPSRVTLTTEQNER